MPPETGLEALRATGFKRVRRCTGLSIFSEHPAFKPRDAAP